MLRSCTHACHARLVVVGKVRKEVVLGRLFTREPSRGCARDNARCDRSCRRVQRRLPEAEGWALARADNFRDLIRSTSDHDAAIELIEEPSGRPLEGRRTATALLMKRFCENRSGRFSDERNGRTAEPLGKANALAEARAWLRRYEDEPGHRPYEHPYYWSAFVLIGARD
jgi:hypothetical protein